MRRERKPPCRLIYATVAVLSVRTRTSLPRRRPLRRLKARHTTSNSRQFDMPTQLGTRPYPWHCVPVVRGSPAGGRGIREYHNMPGDSSRGTPARRNEGSVHGLKVLRQAGVIWTRWVPAFPRPPRDSAMEPVLKRSHMEQTGRNFAAAAAICPRSLWKSFSGTAVLPDKVLRQFSTDWARTGWGVLSGWPNPTPCREKRSSALARVCSFPSWPENPTGWGARKAGSCTDMHDPRTRIAGMPCVAVGLSHESTRPSGRSLQTNLGDGRTRKCVSASSSWTAACEVHGSKLADPRSVVTHRFSWAQWSRGCKTPTSYRLEGPVLSHPSQDCDFRTQDRGINSFHWSEVDTPELGGTPGELNRVAESDGPQEPPRRTRER